MRRRGTLFLTTSPYPLSALRRPFAAERNQCARKQEKSVRTYSRVCGGNLPGLNICSRYSCSKAEFYLPHSPSSHTHTQAPRHTRASTHARARTHTHTHTHTHRHPGTRGLARIHTHTHTHTHRGTHLLGLVIANMLLKVWDAFCDRLGSQGQLFGHRLPVSICGS